MVITNSKEQEKVIQKHRFVIMILIFLNIVLLSSLIWTKYSDANPVFKIVYTDTSHEIINDGIEKEIYNIHIYAEGHVSEQDLKAQIETIKKDWRNGDLLSNPEAIHVFFYDKPDSYPDNSFFAETYILTPE